MEPLTLDFFRALQPGMKIWLYYNHYNTGAFMWEHSYVNDEGRVVGKFRYGETGEWSEEGDYLYEFRGVVCRGSGAEPCFLGMLPPELTGRKFGHLVWEG